MRHSRHSSRVSPTSGHRLPCKVATATARNPTIHPLTAYSSSESETVRNTQSFPPTPSPIVKDAVRFQPKACQVYGSIATPVNPDKKPPGLPIDHTHQWTVSVKGVGDNDISHFIKKVQFKLHDTYANPLRMIESPPFEVSETGWGEFEIQIKIFFVPECTEKAQTLFHFLKLHPYVGDKAELELARTQRRPVQAFIYDEIIFNEPTEAMFEILTTRGSALVPSRTRNGRGEFTEETEASELDRLTEGIKVVQEHIKKAKDMLLEKERQVAQLKAQLEKK